MTAIVSFDGILFNCCFLYLVVFPNVIASFVDFFVLYLVVFPNVIASFDLYLVVFPNVLILKIETSSSSEFISIVSFSIRIYGISNISGFGN